MLEELRDLAEASDRPLSRVVRGALADHLKRHREAANEALELEERFPHAQERPTAHAACSTPIP